MNRFRSCLTTGPEIRAKSRGNIETGALCLMIAALMAVVPVGWAACRVNASGVSFGSYDPFGSQPAYGVGTISIACDAASTYSIALSTGQGSYAMRSMSNGTQRIDYNLFTDPSYASVWGDGIGGTLVSGSGTSVNYTVYGRIPPRQNVPAGSYSDVITMTLTF